MRVQTFLLWSLHIATECIVTTTIVINTITTAFVAKKHLHIATTLLTLQKHLNYHNDKIALQQWLWQ